MSEANDSNPTPQAPLTYQPPYKAEDFSTFFSNVFQYRVGFGELALLLSTAVNDGTPLGLPQVQHKAEVFVTWSHAKSIAWTLQRVVEVIEEEVGPIPVLMDEDAIRAAMTSLRAHVQNLRLPKTGGSS